MNTTIVYFKQANWDHLHPNSLTASYWAFSVDWSFIWWPSTNSQSMSAIHSSAPNGFFYSCLLMIVFVKGLCLWLVFLWASAKFGMRPCSWIIHSRSNVINRVHKTQCQELNNSSFKWINPITLNDNNSSETID